MTDSMIVQIQFSRAATENELIQCSPPTELCGVKRKKTKSLKASL